PIVVTGGAGTLTSQGLAGADFMYQLLVESGVAADRIIVERQSRNTYENAMLSKPLAGVQPMDQWVLVTSAFHMPRSVAIFQQMDWPVTPWPVDYRTGAFVQRTGWDFAQNLLFLNTGVKEWVGLIVYWATGRAAWPF
ncbi:MAG: YdcF family protein, partial [Pseudomonadota bacterium]